MFKVCFLILQVSNFREFVENDIDGIKTLKYNFIEFDKINEIDLKPEVLKEILKNKKFDNIFHNISCNIKK